MGVHFVGIGGCGPIGLSPVFFTETAKKVLSACITINSLERIA